MWRTRRKTSPWRCAGGRAGPRYRETRVMAKVDSPIVLPAAGAEASEETAWCARIPAEPMALEDTFRTATHDILFAAPTDAPHCDACNSPLPAREDGEAYPLSGHGTYLWTRGDEVHLEEAPLCSACASAIGMTALARWEIEEEEG